jgi:hypothetical protein
MLKKREWVGFVSRDVIPMTTRSAAELCGRHSKTARGLDAKWVGPRYTKELRCFVSIFQHGLCRFNRWQHNASEVASACKRMLTKESSPQ